MYWQHLATSLDLGLLEEWGQLIQPHVLMCSFAKIKMLSQNTW